jgi:hypothetical protein
MAIKASPSPSDPVQFDKLMVDILSGQVVSLMGGTKMLPKPTRRQVDTRNSSCARCLRRLRNSET